MSFSVKATLDEVVIVHVGNFCANLNREQRTKVSRDKVTGDKK